VGSTSSPFKTVSKGFSSFMDERCGEKVMKSHVTATLSAKSSGEISVIYLKLAEHLSPAAGPPVVNFQRPWKSKRCVMNTLQDPPHNEMPRACCFAPSKATVERKILSNTSIRNPTEPSRRVNMVTMPNHGWKKRKYVSVAAV